MGEAVAAGLGTFSVTILEEFNVYFSLELHSFSQDAEGRQEDVAKDQK